MAKTSSVTPKAASSLNARFSERIPFITQADMMKCRRFRINVASTMAAMPAPCAYMPAAIISLAPA